MRKADAGSVSMMIARVPKRRRDLAENLASLAERARPGSLEESLGVITMRLEKR